MKIRKGDNVVVLSGKDKGRRGEVVRALPKEGRIIVEGVHRVKRHQRTTQVRKRPKEHTPTRVAYRVTEGSKSRVCVRCGEGL
jgi:large subunit ribosomal protein L24